MYDDILVPTDGSVGTETTLDSALPIAKDHDATVHVLYVVDKRIYFAAAEGEEEEVIGSLESDGEEAIATVVDRLESEGIDVATRTERGVPYRDILAYVEDNGIDLVAMGTHGRTGRDRLTHLGSVTERVVKRSPVPVLTVRIDGQGGDGG